jgi:ubiquinone biosynthesis protein UbiJ
MTSLNTYTLMEMAESLKNPSHVATIRAAIAEIERLERQVERLSRQLEDLGEKPAPGD